MSDDFSKPEVTNHEYHIKAHPNHDFITTTHGISRIQTSDTHVQLGDMTFHKDEFRRAFEGYLNPGFTSAPSRKFANPVPLGVASFALSLFVLSLVNAGARGLTNAKATAGLCLFYAGFIELCAAMWCVVIENTWAATLLGSFAGFWISYGLLLVDAWGIVSSYNAEDLASMQAFYLLAWLIFAFMMWLFTFKSTWVLFTMMLCVWFTLFLLCCAQFTITSHPTIGAHFAKGGGVVGIITSFIGWFVVYEGIATRENAMFIPPVFLMPGAVTGSSKADENV